ncbi:heterokaryon incompatibility protein-domain-containing protein [Cadophora sp. MPI-SDFR-AT-0126]|nr:heterokaryon incompatibility protein-domain-containing protein [Leotiomycetes sp. MPI-SDFR-AT-0126]
MNNSLQYLPLNEDQDEIRLIRIVPYTSRRFPVECTIETVSLRETTKIYESTLSTSNFAGRKLALLWESVSTPDPRNEIAQDKHNPNHPSHRYEWGDYAALSYVWGEAHDTETIVLNKIEVKVQRNLEAALRALSSRAEFNGRYMLWVDAVCINQADSEERSQQIKWMRTIYGNARAVIGWLGREDEQSEKAFDLIDSLSTAWSKGFGEELEHRLREDPEYLGFGNWSALHDIMRRAYWSRLWIIQELVLGSSSAVLYCGNRSVQWEPFCQGIGFLFEYLWTAKDDIMAQEVRTIYPEQRNYPTWSTTSLHLVFRDLWGLSRIEARGGEDRPSFGQLLDLAKSGESQDPRDKVYGLVGMMDPVVARNIVPDYSLSPAQVYAAIAKTFIITQGNLDVLREANPWRQIQSPSWAPDWTWNGRIRHGRVMAGLSGPFWGPKGEPPGNSLGMPYRASGDIPMEVQFSDDGLYLACRGFIVDELDGLAARERGYFDWPQSTIRQPSSTKNVYQTTDGVIEALWRTLVVDRVAGGNKASHRHAAILNIPADFEAAQRQFDDFGWTWLANQTGYYFRWSGWRVANRDFVLHGKRLDSYFTDTIPESANEYDYTEAYCCSIRTGQGRRFITTMNGYMGWGTDNMFGADVNQLQSGDKIAILFGCSTPIVVRPHGRYYKVLGEAYIHGLMDGETVHSLEAGGFVVQDFVFC